MRLGLKAVLLVAAAATIAMTASLGAATALLLEDYRSAEETEARAMMRQLQDSIARDLLQLEGEARGVADVSEVLFGNGTVSNETIQVLYSIFTVDKIDVIFTLDENGTAAGFAFNRTSFAFTGVDAGLNGSVAGWAPGLDFGPSATHSNVLQGDNGTFMVAMTSLEIAGVGNITALGVGRLMGPEYQEGLAASFGRPVQFDAPAGAFAVERISLERMSVAQDLHGSDGAVVSLQFNMPRDTFQEGMRTIGLASLATGAVVAAMIVSLFPLMRWLVTGRVERLQHAMEAIDVNTDLEKRVPADGDDEVAALASSFNGLMAALQAHQEQLRETNQDLDDFARTVSHDLKSPLSTFSLNLHNVRSLAESLSEGQETALQRMDRGVKLMAERIDAMLAYSRSRTAAIDVKPVDANVVLARVCESMAAEIEQSGAEIRRRQLPVVMADPNLLAQVLQNFLANAIKYAKPDEWPRINVYSRDGAIVIEDFGRGFHPSQAKAMMTPFMRLDNVGNVPGSGIGLATVTRIVERFGGSVEAQGWPGKGARFIVRLPQP